MKRTLVIIKIAVGVLFGLSSCQPKPNLSDLVRDMVVQTSYDKTVNFSSFSTYAMPLDTIGQIYNASPKDTLIIGEYAQVISREVKSMLDKSGYSQVGRKQNPDLAIAIFVVRNYSQFTSVVYPVGGYSSYYYPSYYGYGGYYNYPYIQSYSSSTATLILEILNLRDRNSQNQAKVIWIANIGDVLASPDLLQKSKEGVDQAFAQSTYIKK